VEEALCRADAKYWKEVMQREYSALLENQTWNLTDLPLDKKPLNCKWILEKKKRDNTNEIYKVL